MRRLDRQLHNSGTWRPQDPLRLLARLLHHRLDSLRHIMDRRQNRHRICISLTHNLLRFQLIFLNDNNHLHTTLLYPMLLVPWET